MAFSRDAQNLIANFRGQPVNRSRAIVRPAVEIHDLLSVLQEQYHLNEIRFHQVIQHQWKEIVGEQYASRCHPARLIQEKTLVIAVPNATLRQELYFQKREIMKRLRHLPGGRKIEDIKFVSG